MEDVLGDFARLTKTWEDIQEKQRHVASPEGSRLFKKPIGSIIGDTDNPNNKIKTTRLGHGIAQGILDKVKANGGLSVNMVDGSEPPSGYMVAKDPKLGAIVSATDFFNKQKGEQMLNDYMQAHKEDLATGKNYLGVWHNEEDSNVYLDVSENHQSKDNAIQAGIDRDQISIWDVINQAEIETGGTGHVGESKGNEAKANAEGNRTTKQLGDNDRPGDSGILEKSLRTIDGEQMNEVEIDITDQLTETEIASLFEAMGNDDFAEVDRLITEIENNESKGLDALLNLEIKKGGLDKNRGDAEKLRHYWTVGKGGLKIQWRTPGDWTRCVAELSKYLGVRAKGYCALRHKEMDGFYPNSNKDPDKAGHDLKKVVEKAKGHDKEGQKKVYSEVSVPTVGDRAMNILTKNSIPKMEHKTFGFKNITSIDENLGIVETLIAITGIKDEVNDVIVPGAFKKTLEKRKPKGVWSHNWDNPIAKTLEVRELLPGDPNLPKTMADGRPWNPAAGAVFIKAQFNLDIEAGRNAFISVKFYGDEQEWSLGYNVPAGGAKIDTKSNTRFIHYLDFFEYSPVLFGAMPETRTLALKNRTGQASGWLGQNNADGDGNDLESMAEDATDGQPRLFSGEEVQLLKNSLAVLQNLLASVGITDDSEDPDDLEDPDDDMGDEANENDGGLDDESGFNDPNGNEADELNPVDLGYDNLSDAVSNLVGLNSLPQEMADNLTSLGQNFDNAMQAVDFDGLDTTGNQILDIVESQLPDSDDDTAEALQNIASFIAMVFQELSQSDTSTDSVPDSPKDPMNQDSMSEKDSEELQTETKSFYDSVSSFITAEKE